MAKVLLKKSSVSANAPGTGDLDYGELAINYADGRLYYKNSSNQIKHFIDSDAVAAIIAAGATGLTEVVQDPTPQLGGALDTNGNNITFGDNNKAVFGAGSDLQIFHDGANSYIQDAGTGSLVIRGSDMFLRTPTDDNFLVGAGGASVTLYYNNAAKFATATGGVSVTGNITVSGTVDGRDVAADGTKLDGIESGATADQTITAGSGLTGGGTGDVTLNVGAGSYITVAADTVSVDATTTNTASKVVARDASGNFSAGTITAALSGNASTATALQTARNIALTGAVTGNANFDGTGNISITTTATSDPTLTINGDASGSATFTNLGNATLTLTISDNSHDHTSLVAIDDRDMKPNTSGLSGSKRIRAFFSSKEGMTGTAGTDYHDVLVLDTYSDASGGGPNAITFDKGNAAGDPEAYLWHGTYNGTSWGTGQRIFADNYHPNADKWTTARTLTLNGDVSGSVSWDGSANATLTVTVADDSHNHVISNVDGLQTALDAKAPLASPGLTGTPTAPTAAAGTNTTQIATTAFVSTAVSNLVDAAPTTLDTLNELAAALGDDPNFATTVSNSIGTKVSKTGDTMSGNLSSTAFIGTAQASTAPSTDDARFDGFGVQGNRTTNPVYIHNHGNGGVRISANAALGTANGVLVTDTGINVSGNIAVSGTVDGRDIAADGTKLDGIETGATADQTITAGSGLTGGGTGDVTISHADTSTQASVNNSNGTVIQDVTLDGFGHVTGLASVDLDGRYYTESEVDTRMTYTLYSPTNAPTDLNSLSHRGWYSWSSSPTNAPATYGMLIDGADGNQPQQLVQTYGGAANKVSLYGRRKTNGSWDTTWTQYFSDHYHPNADKWTTARTLTLTGAVTGSVSIDGSGNVSLATTATSDPTLTLSGDVTGSATFTNLGNATLTATVADDSHNHSSSSGNFTVGGDLTVNGGQVYTNSTEARVKLGVWSSSTYGIGMQSGYTYGGIGNDYVMSFQMSNTNTRGFWWGDSGHTNAQGAMALTTDGKLTVANSARIGFGESDTTTPGTSYTLQVNGSFAATTKSFVIDHPTKEGMKLRHGSLEGPEDGVYVRGRLKDNNVIELPDYWLGLVHEDTITVNLTAIGKSQDLYVEDIIDNKVIISGSDNINCFYTVFAERKDVDRWAVEYEG